MIEKVTGEERKTNYSSSIRDLSIAVFFLTVSILLIIGGTLINPTMDSIIEIQQEKSQAIAQTLASVQDAIKIVQTEFQSSMVTERAHLKKLTMKAESSAAFIEEIAVLIGVRALEDNSILAPSTSDEMARDAIQKIKSSHSERIGKLLEAVNDKFLRDRR
jgi:hypothetical protein